MSEQSSESELNSPEEDEDIVIESSDDESVLEDDSEVDEKKPIIKEHFTIPFEDKEVEEEEINKYIELYKNKERRMEKSSHYSIAEHDPEYAVKTLQNLIKKYLKKQIEHFKRAIEKCTEKGKSEELPELEEKLNLLQKVDKINLMHKLLLYVYKLDENDEKVPVENKPIDDEEQNRIINIFLTETKLKNDIDRSLFKPSEMPRDKNLQTKYEYISKLKEKMKMKQLQQQQQQPQSSGNSRNNRQYILDGIGSSSSDDRRRAAKLLKDKMINKKEYPMRRKKSDYNEDGSLKAKAIKRERERVKDVEDDDNEKGYDNRKKRRMNQKENVSFNRNNNSKSNDKRRFNNDSKKLDKKQNNQSKAKPEDTSELHPSWAAAKIAKQKQKLKIDLNAAPQSKKIVFE